MEYLTIIGGAFIAWLIIVSLFTPGIPYHSEAPIDARSDHFTYVLESICNTTLKTGNSIEILTNGPQFYPAMLKAIAEARANGEPGVLHLQEGEDRRPVHRCAVRTRPGRRARDHRHGHDRQLRRVPSVGETAASRRLPGGALSPGQVVYARPPQQPHPPRTAGRRRPGGVRRRRRHRGLVDHQRAPQEPEGHLARFDGTHRRAGGVRDPGRGRGELAGVPRRDSDRAGHLLAPAADRNHRSVHGQELARGSRHLVARAVPDAARRRPASRLDHHALLPPRPLPAQGVPAHRQARRANRRDRAGRRHRPAVGASRQPPPVRPDARSGHPDLRVPTAR